MAELVRTPVHLFGFHAFATDLAGREVHRRIQKHDHRGIGQILHQLRQQLVTLNDLG